MTALDVQWLYFEAARRWLELRGDDPDGDDHTTEVMERWERRADATWAATHGRAPACSTG